MTRPKGSQEDQVQRLRLRAAEAFVKKLEKPNSDFWPSHEDLGQYRELLQDVLGVREGQDVVDQRLRALEETLAQMTGRAMEADRGGALRLG